MNKDCGMMRELYLPNRNVRTLDINARQFYNEISIAVTYSGHQILYGIDY